MTLSRSGLRSSGVRLGSQRRSSPLACSLDGCCQGPWGSQKNTSMGSVGDRFDNAMVESFWSPMQVELLDRKRRHTRIEFANAIFESLEIWHSRQRRHTSLGMLTPIEFEARHQHRTAA